MLRTPQKVPTWSVSWPNDPARPCDDDDDDDYDGDGDDLVAGTSFLTPISIPAHNESNPTQAQADSAQLRRLFWHFYQLGLSPFCFSFFGADGGYHGHLLIWFGPDVYSFFPLKHYCGVLRFQQTVCANAEKDASQNTKIVRIHLTFAMLLFWHVWSQIGDILLETKCLGQNC